MRLWGEEPKRDIALVHLGARIRVTEAINIEISEASAPGIDRIHGAERSMHENYQTDLQFCRIHVFVCGSAARFKLVTFHTCSRKSVKLAHPKAMSPSKRERRVCRLETLIEDNKLNSVIP